MTQTPSISEHHQSIFTDTSALLRSQDVTNINYASQLVDQVLAMAPRDDAPRAPTTDRHYGTAPVTLARRALAPASSGTTAVRGVDAPPIVSDALGTPGRPLDGTDG